MAPLPPPLPPSINCGCHGRLAHTRTCAGYSDYLHPIDDNTLLGVGQAGDDNGRIRGVKLALFDISDLTSPRELGGVELGGRSSTTPISDDHKAFLYDPNRQLLVVPVTEKSGWSCDEPPAFHGAKVFTLGESGFTLRAAIEHGPNSSHTLAFPEQQRDWSCVAEVRAARARVAWPVRPLLAPLLHNTRTHARTHARAQACTHTRTRTQAHPSPSAPRRRRTRSISSALGASLCTRVRRRRPAARLALRRSHASPR